MDNSDDEMEEDEIEWEKSFEDLATVAAPVSGKLGYDITDKLPNFTTHLLTF